MEAWVARLVQDTAPNVLNPARVKYRRKLVFKEVIFVSNLKYENIVYFTIELILWVFVGWRSPFLYNFNCNVLINNVLK